MKHDHRAYYVTPRAHIISDHEAEVMFGIYPDEDSRGDVQLAEMAIRWRTLGDDLTARLEVFDESWAALATMPDLLLWLGTLSRHDVPGMPHRRRPPITVDEVASGLEALGFQRRS